GGHGAGAPGPPVRGGRRRRAGRGRGAAGQRTARTGGADAGGGRRPGGGAARGRRTPGVRVRAGGGGAAVIRILVADDQALVLGALAAMLDLEPDLEVVARVGDGAQVVAEARRTRPDVALIDVRMPGVDGLTAAADLVRALPSCRVLMCTTFDRPGYLARA